MYSTSFLFHSIKQQNSSIFHHYFIELLNWALDSWFFLTIVLSIPTNKCTRSNDVKQSMHVTALQWKLKKKKTVFYCFWNRLKVFKALLTMEAMNIGLDTNMKIINKTSVPMNWMNTTNEKKKINFCYYIEKRFFACEFRKLSRFKNQC